MNLKEELAHVLGGDVAVDTETLKKNSRDASIFEVMPSAVVYPKGVEDVQKLVRWAQDARKRGENVSLTARAAGTDMSGGSLTKSVVISFTEHMHNVSITTGTATVEPGVYYRDFEKKAAEKNWLMPAYPASKDLCALGGMIANNAAGELTLQYGKVDQFVESLDVVLDDSSVITVAPLTERELEQKKTLLTREGKIYRDMHELIKKNRDAIRAAQPTVSKNSSGYALWNVWDDTTRMFDLTKLIVGSQGTLGLFTSAQLRLVRPHKHTAVLVTFLRSLDALPEIVNRLRPHEPQAIESFDDQTLKLAIRFAPEIIKKMKGSFISLMFSFWPEAKMVLFNGLPKLIILTEFAADSRDAAIAHAKKAQEALADLHVQTHVADQREAEKYWTMRRKSFDLLRKHYKGLRASAFVDDIVVHPEDLPAFFPEMRELLDQYDIINTVTGHVGDGNFHIIPLVDFSKAETPAMIRELTEKMYALVQKYNGSISGEHNDGLIRTGYLSYMFNPEMLDIFAQTKNIFDPNNIFNPGKKVGLTADEAFKHIIKREPQK